jgi:hypothetical protein
MGHWRNQGGDLKIPRIKWKWKHSLPEPLGYSKCNSKRKVYEYLHLKKSVRSQINNLMMHLKLLKKKSQNKPKQKNSR